MNQRLGFPLMLLPLAIASGLFLSKASWVGRTGINLFYQQYKFLKTWWQAGLVVWLVWTLLYFVQDGIARRLKPSGVILMHLVLLLVLVLGLFLTWQDFQQNLAHKWLGKTFHWGAYVFWLGWLLVIVKTFRNNRTINSAA